MAAMAGAREVSRLACTRRISPEAVLVTPWPDVRLGPADRLRVIARALPHAALVEREIPALFASVWPIVGGLEGSAPRYETFVWSARILE